jgi:hypothetical protein
MTPIVGHCEIVTTWIQIVDDDEAEGDGRHDANGNVASFLNVANKNGQKQIPYCCHIIIAVNKSRTRMKSLNRDAYNDKTC